MAEELVQAADAIRPGESADQQDCVL